MAVTGGAIVNLICNWLLIPQMGSIGATLGTLMAEIAVLVISVSFARKNINFSKMFIRHGYYYLFGLAMYIVVRFFSFQLHVGSVVLQLLLMIVIGGSVYCTFCFILWLVIKDKSVFGSIIVSFHRKGKVER